MIRASWERRFDAGLRLMAVLLLLIATAASLHAQNDTEFDTYKIRVSGFWFYSNPSGTLEGHDATGTIDLNKDLGFNTYSTFSGKLDWKFTHKNHLYVIGGDLSSSRTTTLNRTFVFQDQTFDVGLITHSELHAPLIAPGYEYDIIRRRRGNLGVAVQIDFFNVSASISAAAQVTSGGVHYDAVSAKGSLLAPLPVAGPEGRFYLTNSPRFFVDGNIYGMYFFGYGNFISTSDDVGVAITKHLSVKAGYQLGTRLVVNNSASNDRIGLHLTQRGPIVGIEASF